jgi:hypothetical protein
MGLYVNEVHRGTYLGMLSMPINTFSWNIRTYAYTLLAEIQPSDSEADQEIDHRSLAGHPPSP